MKRKTTKRKNPNLYVAKATLLKRAPREGIVKTVTSILKEKQYKMVKKHVKRISVTTTINHSGFTVMGRWRMTKEQVQVFDSGYQSEDRYDHVVRHEFAHAEFHYLKKYNPEAHARFVELALKHTPVSTYVSGHERKFRRQINQDRVSMYADEQHSETAVRLANKMVLHRTEGELSDELVEAYKELHFL
jgi:hypothetical protein